MNDQEQLEKLEEIFSEVCDEHEIASDLFVIVRSKSSDFEHWGKVSQILTNLNQVGVNAKEFGSSYDCSSSEFVSYLFCWRTNNDEQVHIPSAAPHTITVLTDIAWAMHEPEGVSMTLNQSNKGGQAAGIRQREYLVTHDGTGISTRVTYEYLKEKRIKQLAHDILMATMFSRLKQLRKQWA